MNENAFNPNCGSAVEEYAVDVEVDGSEILELSIRIFIGSKTQIPNVLLSKEAFTVSWRIGNLGLVLGPTQWRSVCLLFKIFFATTQKYILNKGTPLRSHALRKLVCCSITLQTRHSFEKMFIENFCGFGGSPPSIMLSA